MSEPAGEDPASLLWRSLESGRIHSAYLLSGPGPGPREAALAFARGLVCAGADEARPESNAARSGSAAGSPPSRPCERCPECQRTAGRAAIPLDGTGKKGPLLRHVGDHPDLVWLERGASDTRVRIGQIRALQHELGLRGWGAGRRAAVIADAEWLNLEAQNALLRVLEEPPPRTTLVLVAATAAGLLATLRSRCQRVFFRPPAQDPLDDPERREVATRLDSLAAAGVPQILDWAEEFRGARADAVDAVHRLLDTALAWLARRVGHAVRERGRDVRRELDAGRVILEGRRHLDQRNANPQMVAERVLFALREAAAE
jgi:DNA polymerase III delta prime subunit